MGRAARIAEWIGLLIMLPPLFVLGVQLIDWGTAEFVRIDKGTVVNAMKVGASLGAGLAIVTEIPLLLALWWWFRIGVTGRTAEGFFAEIGHESAAMRSRGNSEVRVRTWRAVQITTFVIAQTIVRIKDAMRRAVGLR